MTAPKASTRKPFTGWHMTAILVSGFAVVLAVNITMARLASSTFGGEVVKNSYVASQHFNRWLGEAAQERALGWDVDVARRADGRLAVRLTGAPPHAAIVAQARHPLGRRPDVALTFEEMPEGLYLSRGELPSGRWLLRFEITAGGQVWRGEDQVEGQEVIGQPVP